VVHATREHEREGRSAGADRQVATRGLPPGAAPHLGKILGLQRSAGNAAVNRLLQRCGAGGCTCGGACGGRHGDAEPAQIDYRDALAASGIVVSGLNRMRRRDRALSDAKTASRGPEQIPLDELQTRGPEQVVGNKIQTRPPATVPLTIPRALLQRDFALRPPRPDAVGRTLTEAQMRAALRFNDRVVSVIGTDGIRELRDVLGVSPDPAVIDEDFINAIVQWQAMQRLTQDGMLGPTSARPLFREIGAEGAGRGEVESGPRYNPSGAIAAPVVAGNQSATFRMSARFRHDPAHGIYASCCEVRQDIRWDATSAAALPGGIPHAGFPAGTAADTWIEDRDAANHRYGHRAGPFTDPQDFDQYIDTNGRRNQAFGHRYRGSDTPGGPDALLAGNWRFRLRVVDVCNGNAGIGGQDFVRVNW
jgi:hypothetical protein